MKRQSGYGLLAYLIAGAVVIGLLLTAAAAVYNAGKAAERALWQAREAEEVTRLNAEIDRLQREARAAEQDHAEDLAAISTNYQKELRDAKRAHDAHVAAVRSGALRLRDPEAPAREGTCADRVPEAGAGAGGNHGAKDTGLLSKAASVFLLEEAQRADEIVRQLQACQAVVRRDRSMGDSASPMAER